VFVPLLLAFGHHVVARFIHNLPTGNNVLRLSLAEKNGVLHCLFAAKIKVSK
jgi:hypothetical protein